MNDSSVSWAISVYDALLNVKTKIRVKLVAATITKLAFNIKNYKVTYVEVEPMLEVLNLNWLYMTKTI